MNQKSLFRIKSPQLYRLSYRPKFSGLLRKLLSYLPTSCRGVPPVYPGPIARGAYHDFGDDWRRVVS